MHLAVQLVPPMTGFVKKLVARLSIAIRAADNRWPRPDTVFTLWKWNRETKQAFASITKSFGDLWGLGSAVNWHVGRYVIRQRERTGAVGAWHGGFTIEPHHADSSVVNLTRKITATIWFPYFTHASNLYQTIKNKTSNVSCWWNYKRIHALSVSEVGSMYR